MICVRKNIYIYNINNNSLMSDRYNIIYIKDLIKWIKMFTKILNNKNNQKYLFNRLNYLTNLIGNKYRLINIIKNNIEIKNEYNNIFKKIIKQYNYNSSILKIIIDSLK